MYQDSRHSSASDVDYPHSFIMSDGSHTLSARGVAVSYESVEAADAMLRAGNTELVVGALPFHSRETPALFSPRTHWHAHGAPDNFWEGSDSFPSVTGTDSLPDISTHAARVQHSVDRINQGRLRKVVLSRQERFELESTPHPEHLLDRFAQGSATGHCHLVELTAAGINYDGHYFIGSSPELLIFKRGAYIRSHPLAGTTKRASDPVVDQARATELTLSAKDIHEHKFVTSEIKRVLEPLCTSLNVPETPELTSTSHTWHLGTVIEGTLKDPNITALELARLLHPTPAVSGMPQREAQELLWEEEPDRGFYAGAVGWADSAGNGEWRVAIRSAELHEDTVVAHAGGGIVADSDPAAEVEETQMKLGPVRAAVGLSRVPAQG